MLQLSEELNPCCSLDAGNVLFVEVLHNHLNCQCSWLCSTICHAQVKQATHTVLYSVSLFPLRQWTYQSFWRIIKQLLQLIIIVGIYCSQILANLPRPINLWNPWSRPPLLHAQKLVVGSPAYSNPLYLHLQWNLWPFVEPHSQLWPPLKPPL